MIKNFPRKWGKTKILFASRAVVFLLDTGLRRYDGLIDYPSQTSHKELHMNQKIPSIESAVAAFLLAVSAAAILFPLIEVIDMAASMLWHSGFDVSALAQLHRGESVKPLYIVVEVVVIWVLALVSGCIPYAICIAVAREFGIFHWWYFVACGVLTAVGPSFLLVAGLFGWGNESLLNPALLHHYLTMLPGYSVSGAVAGFVCWRYLRYRLNGRGLASA